MIRLKEKHSADASNISAPFIIPTLAENELYQYQITTCDGQVLPLKSNPYGSGLCDDSHLLMNIPITTKDFIPIGIH